MRTKLTNISTEPLEVKIWFVDHGVDGEPIPQDDVIHLPGGQIFWCNAELNYAVDITRARDLRVDTWR